MKYIYEIELAGRSISISSDVWRTISDYIHSGQWFYIVHLGKMYKYSMTHSFFDRPAIYMFDLVDDIANERIKYIFI